MDNVVPIKSERSLDEIGKSLDGHLIKGSEEWIAAGEDLIEAREKVAHGKWILWLEDHGLAERSARNLVYIARVFSNRPRAAGLDLTRRAMELLAAPSTPEDVREEIIERAETGEKITRDDIQTAIKERKKPDLSRWHSCSTNPIPLPEDLSEYRVRSAVGPFHGLSYSDLQKWAKRMEEKEPKVWRQIVKIVSQN